MVSVSDGTRFNSFRTFSTVSRGDIGRLFTAVQGAVANRPSDVRDDWQPKTALGRALAEGRARAIAAGMTLMSADEISVALGRSEVE